MFDSKSYEDNLAYKFLKDCKHILDLGCGEGRFMELAPEKMNGLDHTDSSLKICRDKGLKVEKGEVLNLPYESSSFDGVHCSHVIEHLSPDDAHVMLKEINRVLQVGGVLVLRSPLMHKNFYADFSHVKPYYPSAIMHYLKTTEVAQNTMSEIPGLYEKIALIYRYEPLGGIFLQTPLKFLGMWLRGLARFGITSMAKTGYLLVLKKVK